MAESTVRDTEEAPEAGEEVAEVTEESRIKAMSIYEKLFSIMAELGPLEKDAEVTGNNGKVMYEYISHDAVTAHIRPKLVKYRVMVEPIVTQRANDGNRTELDVLVRFINVDSPQEYRTVSVVGYGVDPSDKGPGKAFSYALKYAYLKLFLLNSGDDIEAQDVPHDSAVMTASQKEDSERRVVEDIQTWAETFKLALMNAKDVTEVDTLQKANKDKLMKAPEVTRDYFIGLIEKRKNDLGKPEPTLGV